ncbi:hypothetical protein SAMN05216302_105312 [Nitrosomonas aestuarii]|uniref:50S ribosomal protein L29 n=1 Tax=Nitrosomonas aestuarii TaxID=52441 RepID=A0A1I4GFT2_9PROT|nr:hypothetical protein SAMN05216302_105312 [Nitrosomonas aestuarii]
MQSDVEKLETLLLTKKIQLNVAEKVKLSKLFVASLRKEIRKLSTLLELAKHKNI